ncbi:uncharacterized protein LOC111698382 isoform X2 [Eurytemora carolleeae]|nr:uncharacterized protein LOC111698382 isoform X2 [Eurytemora carolleeae]XP_023324467.1 uncharacterized protein LOC111698382 isoform X2 [Eurytemora carolleeae]|eukprot:XP_023324465.1 uncharacterized protein LOC111698382 isoform X2 [Eurytemora affinis]
MNVKVFPEENTNFGRKLGKLEGGNLVCKYLKFLIYILLVPVSIDNQTSFNFRFISVRVLFSLVVWSLLGIGAYYPFYYHIFTSGIPVDDIIAETVWRSCKAALVLFLPLSLGYLLKNIQTLDKKKELRISCYTEITLLISLSVANRVLSIANYFAYPETWTFYIWLTSVLADTVNDFVVLNSVFVVNIIGEDFINSVKDLKNISAVRLTILSEETIEAYNNLKIGMGPVLFIFFSMITFLLMTVIHDAIHILGHDGKFILGSADLLITASLFIILLNISDLAENCYEALMQINSYHRSAFMACSLDLKFKHLLVMHNIDSKTRLTALGFFPADRTSVLGAVGTAATFLLIILQASVFE